MKRIFVYILMLGVVFSSCEKFLDVNESLDTPERSTPNYLLPAVLGNMAYTTFEQGDLTSCFTQQMTTRYGTSSYKDVWDFRNTYRMGVWRKNYFDVAGNANKMIQFAETEGSQNYIGVGKVMKAYSFLTATDLFGDMPVLEAFTGIYNPTYDPQEIVYNEIGRWLDEGIVALENASITDRKMDALSDRIYEGNIGNWIAFAHALKARYYLHLGDYSNVLTEITEAKKTWKEPVYTFFADAANSWGKNPWGPSKARAQWDMIENYLDYSVSTDFFNTQLTLGNDSARLFALTSPGKNNTYRSIPASEGLGALSIDDFAKLTFGYWTKDDSPIIFITTEEVYFMEAEAAFHLSDKTKAYESYLKGIRANFTKLNLTDKVENYINNEEIIAQNSTELKISDIMIQKYIALYLQPETWADMRRHDYSNVVYPGLKYPENAASHLNGAWIQRLPYDPQTEYIYNPKEIDRLGAKADDWVGKKMWWVEQATK